MEHAPAAAAETGINFTPLEIAGIAAIAYLTYRGLRNLFSKS
jgi:hypothetical protein